MCKISNFWILKLTLHATPFWSCLITCKNIRWIRRVLWKIQSGQDSPHRRTEGRTRRNQYNPFQLHITWGWGGGIMINPNQDTKLFIQEKTLQNVVCKMAANLFRRKWVSKVGIKPSIRLERVDGRFPFHNTLMNISVFVDTRNMHYDLHSNKNTVRIIHIETAII